MKRRRPPFYSVLALWLSCTLSASAQEFYIELRGPETPAAQEVPPAPASPAPAAAPVRVTRYGPITTTDTLWSIAARHTIAPATVQQTMVALYRLNPDAFVRGNINSLQRGAYLQLPTLTQAQQRTPREAEAEFRRLSRQGARTQSAPAPRPAAPAPRPAAVATVSEPVVQSAPSAATPPVVASEPVPAPEPAVTPSSAETTAVTTPAEQPAPVSEPAETPVVAQSEAPAPKTEEPAEASGLSAPKPAPVVTSPRPAPVMPAAPVAATPTAPERAEQAALERLQARLLDELREQVAMSNEQLAALADNNQALRNRLTQLTAEVNELKMVRETAAALPEENASWFEQLLRQPLNLALLLTLPALMLLALFTLWWRKRSKQDLAEQEAESTELMMEDEGNEFDELFATELDSVEQEPLAEQPQAAAEPETEIDEDAFARFLEEQELLEAQEQEQAIPPTEEPDEGEQVFADETLPSDAEPELEDVLFDDAMAETDKADEAEVDLEDVLFDDAMAETDKADEAEVDLDDVLFDDAMAETAKADEAEVDLDDVLFDDAMAEADKADAAEAELDEALFDAPGADPQQDELAAESIDDILFDNAAGNTREQQMADGADLDELMAEVQASDNPAGVDDDFPLGDLSADEPASGLDEDELERLLAEAGSEPAEAPLFAGDLDESFGSSERQAERSAAFAEPEDTFPDFEQLLNDSIDEQARPDKPVATESRQELDDYAELLGGRDVDIDIDEGGMGAKLDLARAYIEIEDIDSARELLGEALEKGNEQQQSEARKLLQRLDRR